MPDLKERAIALISSTTIADMSAAAVSELYAVPPGKQLIVDSIVLHTASATLVGLDDVDIGGGAAAKTPVLHDNVTALAEITAVNTYYRLRADTNDIVNIDGDDATVANRVLNLSVVDGAAGANSVIVDVFGYLIDS